MDGLPPRLVIPSDRYAATAGYDVVIEFDALDAAEVDRELVEVTVKVYEVPAVSPETVIGDEDDEPVIDPGLDVATYVTVPPLPVKEGGVNATVAVVALVAVAIPTVGTPGNLPD